MYRRIIDRLPSDEIRENHWTPSRWLNPDFRTSGHKAGLGSLTVHWLRLRVLGVLGGIKTYVKASN